MSEPKRSMQDADSSASNVHCRQVERRRAVHVRAANRLDAWGRAGRRGTGAREEGARRGFDGEGGAPSSCRRTSQCMALRAAAPPPRRSACPSSSADSLRLRAPARSPLSPSRESRRCCARWRGVRHHPASCMTRPPVKRGARGASRSASDLCALPTCAHQWAGVPRWEAVAPCARDGRSGREHVPNSSSPRRAVPRTMPSARRIVDR